VIIKWLGHASFLLESASIKLLTDPFNAEIGYQLYKDNVDIVTVSHEHWDHNAVDTISGNPRVIRETGLSTIDGINILGISSFHDKKQGQERGNNIIFKISSENLDILHLGDLGHVLTDRQLMEVGNADILLVPVGGRYTVDAEAAYQIVEQLQPSIIIPMHFLTPDVSLKELAPVEAFTAKFPRVIKKPFLEISKEALTPEAKVIVLDYPH
jgi:L-ascorbate metabolism protein UlaG (beta-lactamase superfamily)